jgi:hypothetical protein
VTHCSSSDVGEKSSPIRWNVEIVRKGRGGPVFYVEGDQKIAFDFELGRCGIIYCPPASDWDSSYPWAAGRRRQILDRVAVEFVRGEFKGSTFAFVEGRDDMIHIRPPVRR